MNTKNKLIEISGIISKSNNVNKNKELIKQANIDNITQEELLDCLRNLYKDVNLREA